MIKIEEKPMESRTTHKCEVKLDQVYEVETVYTGDVKKLVEGAILNEAKTKGI